MKTTNFFTEIGKYATDADLKITITKKGDIVSVTLLPELKNGSDKLMPFVASGTEHELDEGFLPEMEKAVAAAGGFKTNQEQFAKALTEHHEEEAKEEAEKQAKNKSKKASTPKKDKKSKPAKKSPGKKSAAPKNDKKEKPPVVEAEPKAGTEGAVESGPVKTQESLF